MGHSKAQKEANHDRILEAAMDLLRHKGLNHMGVAEVMRAAGLTHGGFYSHFDSREAMVAEALRTAFARDERRLDKAAHQRGGEKRLAMLEAYLSPAHRDQPGQGLYRGGPDRGFHPGRPGAPRHFHRTGAALPGPGGGPGAGG